MILLMGYQFPPQPMRFAPTSWSFHKVRVAPGASAPLAAQTSTSGLHGLHICSSKRHNQDGSDEGILLYFRLKQKVKKYNNK